jgi:hypothetical protein
MRAHEQKAHGLQWVESTGMANKNIAFAMLVGLAKRFEAYYCNEASFSMTLTDLLYLLVAQMPRCSDLAIFVVTDRQTDRQT